MSYIFKGKFLGYKTQRKSTQFYELTLPISRGIMRADFFLLLGCLSNFIDDQCLDKNDTIRFIINGHAVASYTSLNLEFNKWVDKSFIFISNSDNNDIKMRIEFERQNPDKGQPVVFGLDDLLITSKELIESVFQKTSTNEIQTSITTKNIKKICDTETSFELTLINQQRASITNQLIDLLRQVHDLLQQEQRLGQKQTDLLNNILRP